ncbi:aminoacyl-tRNA hydrolase [Corynebacterium ulceribovis]|uniref:aminoacyl-tRNA hydrolase n=1 Tax=Corynebacterium ulceribovis TaxID=487732 RepID=UPI0003681597|nr:aminoacyl-tRNA hydrolase [Corynebacterium ulceribovis]
MTNSATSATSLPADGPVLIVGLGNPGPKYAATRHNIGQMVVDELADRTLPMPSTFSAHKRSNTEIVQTKMAGRTVILAKTRSYMNVSGTPVASLAKFFKVQPGNVIMVHDELDVDFGKVRVKLGGGEGGHNGLRSTSQSLGTKDYLRVRVGIGRPPGRMDVADYVLRPFSSVEAKEVPFLISDAADAAELLVNQGLAAAQNIVHAK